VAAAVAAVRIVVAPRLVLDALAGDAVIPAGTRVATGAGFWVALVGLALVAAGCVLGLSRGRLP
jgi:hypothetical protein